VETFNNTVCPRVTLPNIIYLSCSNSISQWNENWHYQVDRRENEEIIGVICIQYVPCIPSRPTWGSASLRQNMGVYPGIHRPNTAHHEAANQSCCLPARLNRRRAGSYCLSLTMRGDAPDFQPHFYFKHQHFKDRGLWWLLVEASLPCEFLCTTLYLDIHGWYLIYDRHFLSRNAKLSYLLYNSGKSVDRLLGTDKCVWPLPETSCCVYGDVSHVCVGRWVHTNLKLCRFPDQDREGAILRDEPYFLRDGEIAQWNSYAVVSSIGSWYRRLQVRVQTKDYEHVVTSLIFSIIFVPISHPTLEESLQWRRFSRTHTTGIF
jgi:hypothetical protein